MIISKKFLLLTSILVSFIFVFTGCGQDLGDQEQLRQVDLSPKSLAESDSNLIASDVSEIKIEFNLHLSEFELGDKSEAYEIKIEDKQVIISDLELKVGEKKSLKYHAMSETGQELNNELIINVADIITEGIYHLQVRRSNKLLDVANISDKNGANVQQWSNNGQDNQKWKIEEAGNGYYKIIAQHSGKLLDVANISDENGANVQQWAENGQENQHWSFSSTGDRYYKITARHSGKVLELEGTDSVENGDNIQQWEYVNGPSQQWELVKVDNNEQGFYVSNGRLYDATGEEFIMRGINHAHTWWAGHLGESMQGIANKGANTVRVVLSNGEHDDWGAKTSQSEVENIIKRAKANNLIPVLEVHDTTGYGEKSSAAHMSTAVDYWIDIKEALEGEEGYVIINIANEPVGNNNASQWTDMTKKAIKRLRNAGLKHTLMVDAPNWGQDWENIMKDNANTVFNADSEKNTIFSVHMYEVYGNYSDVNDYMSSFDTNNLPLVVGEFGISHKGQAVAHKKIMERADHYGFGYLGWSWKGNSSNLSYLDIVEDWSGNRLSTWGQDLINYSQYGIRDSSETCKVFE